MRGMRSQQAPQSGSRRRSASVAVADGAERREDEVEGGDRPGAERGGSAARRRAQRVPALALRAAILPGRRRRRAGAGSDGATRRCGRGAAPADTPRTPSRDSPRRSNTAPRNAWTTGMSGARISSFSNCSAASSSISSSKYTRPSAAASARSSGARDRRVAVERDHAAGPGLLPVGALEPGQQRQRGLGLGGALPRADGVAMEAARLVGVTERDRGRQEAAIGADGGLEMSGGDGRGAPGQLQAPQLVVADRQPRGLGRRGPPAARSPADAPAARWPRPSCARRWPDRAAVRSASAWWGQRCST